MQHLDLGNPLLWAMLGTLFGGSGLAILNKFLNRGQSRFDMASKIRDELRTDIKRYQDEVNGYKIETGELRKEVDSWRTRYFDLDRDHNATIETMQDEIDGMKRVLRDNGLTYTPTK